MDGVKDNVPWWDGIDRSTLVVLILLSLIPVLGYQFGLGNQVEQFPIIERMNNPDFAVGDFYVDSAEGFGPRFYYAVVMAAISTWVPLPLLIFVATLLTNLAIAVATYMAARRVLAIDPLAASIAAALVLLNSSFSIGLACFVRFDSFQPASIATPLVLWGILALLSGRNLFAALLFAAGSLFHPQIGVELGVIAFAGYFLATLLSGGLERDNRPALIQQFASGILFLALVFLAWGVPIVFGGAASMPGAEVVHALHDFRAPHHFKPFSFPKAHYISTAAFCLGVALIGWRFHLLNGWTRERVALALMAFITIALCTFSVIAIEGMQNASIASAQVFRNLLLVKWIGFLFVGWQLSIWARDTNGFGFALAALCLLAPTDVQPLVLVLCVSFRIGVSFLGLRGASALAPMALVFFASLYLVRSTFANTEVIRLLLAGCVLASVYIFAKTQARGAQLAMVLVACVLSFAFINKNQNWVSGRAFNPKTSWADIQSPDAEIARWAKVNTDADALWMTPPEFETFRLLSGRGVIADYTSVPFTNEAMKEWRERMRVQYGEVSGGGFVALGQMMSNYRAESPARHRETMLRYGAAYAVLYSESYWDGPVLFDNGTFKAVRR